MLTMLMATLAWAGGMSPTSQYLDPNQPVEVVLVAADPAALLVIKGDQLVHVEKTISCDDQACYVSFSPRTRIGDVLRLAHPEVTEPNGRKGAYSIPIWIGHRSQTDQTMVASQP